MTSQTMMEISPSKAKSSPTGFHLPHSVGDMTALS
jgi:hypothetical protein